MPNTDRPGLMGRLTDQVRGGVLNLAVAQCARLFAGYLDGFGHPARGVSAADLEATIITGRNPILDAVASASPQQITAVRSAFRGVAGDFRREHHTPDGRSLGHPYMWVLQEDCLSRDHQEHVAVILRHQQRYKRHMDQAMDWLFGPDHGSARR